MTQAPQHTSYVDVVSPQKGLPPIFRGACICGWTGAHHRKRGAAQADAVAHVVGHQPTPMPRRSRPDIIA